MKVGYIYKITSPKKRVYIGQTIDVKKRFSDYKCLNCKNQTKLFNSFKKHGVDKHNFEILTECDIDELNNVERYYQELFNCISVNGLNLRLVSSNDRSGKHSEESKKLMSIKRKEVIKRKREEGTLVWTKSQRKKINEYRIKNPYKASDEVKEKARIRNTGKIMSQETKDKISKSKKGTVSWNKGKPQSEDRKKRHSEIMKGRLAEQCKLSKLILNTETGIYYYGALDACNSQSKYKNYSHLNDMLTGVKKNKTSFIRV